MPAPAPALLRTWLRRAESDPAGLPHHAYVDLLGADDEELEALADLADAVRHEAAGEALTFVANRNLDTAVIGAVGAAPDLVDDLVSEAWDLGATEICLQGRLPARSAAPGHPDDGYLDLVSRITARAPLHLHAFRPAEIVDAAVRRGSSPREFLAAAREAGLGSVPGTAARILDDGVRAQLSGGRDLPVTRWIELITTAHAVGLPSTATMVYGHVESTAQQVAHLQALAAIQDRTGGFTEFIAMPVTPALAPGLNPAGFRGPSVRETRAVHAVARLMLHGRFRHVQAAWPKLDPELLVAVLRGGADDVGGLLIDGTLRPDAGAEAGRRFTVGDLEDLARRVERPLRQRTTTYDDPPADRVTALRGPGGGSA